MTFPGYSIPISLETQCYYTPHPPLTKFGGYIGITLSVRLSGQSKLNLGYNFWTRRDEAFILHVCSLCQDLSLRTKNFDLLTLTFDLLLNKLNLKHNFLIKRDWAFILHANISCGKTFLLVPKISTLWPWPWLLTYFWTNLTLALTFEPKKIGISN